VEAGRAQQPSAEQRALGQRERDRMPAGQADQACSIGQGAARTACGLGHADPGQATLGQGVPASGGPAGGLGAPAVLGPTVVLEQPGQGLLEQLTGIGAALRPGPQRSGRDGAQDLGRPAADRV
jgi:hypothetical protein